MESIIRYLDYTFFPLAIVAAISLTGLPFYCWLFIAIDDLDVIFNEICKAFKKKDRPMIAVRLIQLLVLHLLPIISFLNTLGGILIYLAAMSLGNDIPQSRWSH